MEYAVAPAYPTACPRHSSAKTNTTFGNFFDCPNTDMEITPSVKKQVLLPIYFIFIIFR